MSFFDMPAGYNDADLEMAALEDAGNRFARRFRGYKPEQIEALRLGVTIEATMYHGPAGQRQSYAVLIRPRDTDEIGPVLEFSADAGETWHPKAKDARLAATDYPEHVGPTFENPDNQYRN